MQLLNMKQLDDRRRGQAAQILTDSLPQGWPGLAQARADVEAHIDDLGNTMLAALCGDQVIGLGGLLAPSYGGRVFEMHMLAVRADCRGRGVARAIVSALEEEARRRGGLTLFLGADDEQPGGQTSLAQVDLYRDLPEKLREFQPGGHQAGFYLKLGYSIIGVMPDANGRGKPDLFFGKRL